MRFARRRERRRRLERRHVVTLVPNMFTVMSLCAGLTAIRYAVDGRFEVAVAFIGAAVVLDGLDGRAARMLKSTSRLGAELDSLADFVSFGVAPAVLLYLWSLRDVKGVGWALALLFASCCALRLARFNSEIDAPEKPAWMANFFTGIPAPAAAGCALLPMLLAFETDALWPSAWLLNAVVTVSVAVMMVSKVPTWSIKRVRMAPDYVVPALVAAVLVAASLASAPWGTLFALGFAYVLTLPLAVVIAGRQRRRAAAVEPAGARGAVPPPSQDAVRIADGTLDAPRTDHP